MKKFILEKFYFIYIKNIGRNYSNEKLKIKGETTV